MEISHILFIGFAFFAVLGGLDRILGNRFGLGAAFERGIMSIGALMLTMTGMIVLSPVLANLLEPVIVPYYRWLKVDPAMFAGSFLACDMGGASLAKELTQDPQAAALGGIICSSMLGVTITFTIPVAMGTVAQNDRPYVAKGILCGVITVPFGILTGGLVAGIPFAKVVINTLPIIPLALLIALGLWKFEALLIKLFTYFGKLMTALATVGLIAALAQKLTGWVIILGMSPIEDAILTVGEIALLLAGAFPLMWLVQKLLNKPLVALGRRMRVNETSVTGLLTSTVNSIAMFDTVKEMDTRGKVLNMAFAVSASFVFGDHLAFTGGWSPSLIPALIVGKLTAGLTALGIAIRMTKKDA